MAHLNDQDKNRFIYSNLASHLRVLPFIQSLSFFLPTLGTQDTHLTLLFAKGAIMQGGVGGI